MRLPRPLALVAAAAAVAGAPALASADDTVLLAGWASLGEDMPLTGARVVFTAVNGDRIPGLSTRTGASGEFVVEAPRDELPPRVIAHAGVGMVDDDDEGPDRPERLTGWLRAPVDLDGPEAGLVYVTPISTAALALQPEYGTYARASARVRYLLRMPSRTQSFFEPWADGGARLATSDNLVDPQRLVADIERDGGIQGWVDEIEQRDQRGVRENYRPRARAQQQSVKGFFKKASGLIKAVAPGLQVAGAVWGVISDQAKTCNPGQSVVPGLGPLASWVQKQGIVQQDPACQIPGQINALGAQLNSRLDGIQAELGQIKQLLVTQNAQFARIEGVVLKSASTNAAATISDSIAIIQTAQERRQLLMNLVATYTGPRTAANPLGLGMDLDEIYASGDPRAVAAARLINRQAERAVPSRIAGWEIVPARLSLPGVLTPGYGSDGILQLAWKATWASRPAGGGNYEDELLEFSEYVDFFRNLWFLYGVQEVDSLRDEGLPGTLVEQQVMARAPFDDTLEALLPELPRPPYGAEECPEVISLTGSVSSVTCVIPAAPTRGMDTTPNGDFRYVTRVRLHALGSGNGASVPMQACALPGHGVRSARLEVARWSAGRGDYPRFWWGLGNWGPTYNSVPPQGTRRLESTVSRCDAIAPGTRPSSAPWPAVPPANPRLDSLPWNRYSIPVVGENVWSSRTDQWTPSQIFQAQILLAAQDHPILVRIEYPRYGRS